MTSKRLVVAAIFALTAAACSPWSSSGNYLGPDSGSPATPASGTIAADAGVPAETATDAGATTDEDAAAGTTSTTYAVGGAVEGLLGTNLMLSSGKDRIYVQEDGPFVFPTKLHKGDVYEIAIEAQPEYPTQSCTIDEGIGTMPAADLTAVRIWCR